MEEVHKPEVFELEERNLETPATRAWDLKTIGIAGGVVLGRFMVFLSCISQRSSLIPVMRDRLASEVL